MPSYKTYSEFRNDMKKYVNKQEAAIIYSISKSRIMELAQHAGAVYKVGNTALINVEVLDEFLERFKEPRIPLPKHFIDKDKILAKKHQKLVQNNENTPV